jgi:HD-GYP domain-containing protein (c-di-GMP phosphodiesterase class II)
VKSDKRYIITAAIILVLFFSFSAACERASVAVEESTEEIEDTVTEELEDEVAAEEEEKEEEEDERIGTEEFTEKEKLDEIEQTYSIEFRQYLETLDKDYLESLLEDDNTVKQEYDLFDWRNKFYENNIIFIADGNIFPSSWYGSGIDAKAESLSPGEVERSKSIIVTALDKYPTPLLKNNLKSVYVLKSMSFYGVNYGGTNLPPDIVYIANDGVSMGYTDIVIEKTFHHEFSSVLKYNYGFDETAWRQVNPAGFIYFDEATGGAGAIKAGKASQTFDSKEHEMGFLYEYAESTLENDLNSFAENIFIGEESFFNIVESYDKLKLKLDLTVAFYNSLDPVFTIDYFKGL